MTMPDRKTRIMHKACIALIVYLCAMWVLSRSMPLDHMMSGLFFKTPCLAENARSCWFFDKRDKSLTFMLHDLPVHVFTAIAIATCLVFASSFRKGSLRKYRLLCVMLFIAIAAFPGFISILKHTTGHFCPGQLSTYGGPIGAVETNTKPRCFPAGFPSPGFGLMILYFAPLPLAVRRFGLLMGIGLGSFMGIIQMARGEHFLSHNLATCVSALFAGCLVFLFNEYQEARRICAYS